MGVGAPRFFWEAWLMKRLSIFASSVIGGASFLAGLLYAMDVVSEKYLPNSSDSRPNCAISVCAVEQHYAPRRVCRAA
jgi:hypothetical protein